MRLMKDQNERDPLFYYEVKKTIGTGSMGSVVLVKKRSQTLGGSARKKVRDAVRNHKWKQRCFQLPLGIGGLFRFCIDDELRVVEPERNKRRRGFDKNAWVSTETWTGSSSIGGGSEDLDDDGCKAFSSLSENEYAMKSIHLRCVTDDSFELIQELKNEIDILKKLDHPHIVRVIYKDVHFVSNLNSHSFPI